MGNARRLIMMEWLASLCLTSSTSGIFRRFSLPPPPYLRSGIEFCAPCNCGSAASSRGFRVIDTAAAYRQKHARQTIVCANALRGRRVTVSFKFQTRFSICEILHPRPRALIKIMKINRTRRESPYVCVFRRTLTIAWYLLVLSYFAVDN